MVSFFLVLQETDRFEGDYTGRELIKQCEHQTLPDLDHSITIGLSKHVVSDIDHDLETGIIKVLVPMITDDFIEVWRHASIKGWERQE